MAVFNGLPGPYPYFKKGLEKLCDYATNVNANELQHGKACRPL